MKYPFILVSLLLASQVHAELIGNQNYPWNFKKFVGTNLISDFNDLPLSGGLVDDRYGWSETYWPSNVGSIAYRWNHPNPQPFKYKMYTLAELKTMSQNQLEQLSPAELYDIAQGDYSYSLTRKVLSLNSPKDLWWEGICHGWAPAAINYPEPSPVVVTNKDGIKVPFGSSDVKGLLTAYEAYNYDKSLYASVGVRCAAPGKVPGEGDSRDSNSNPPTEEQANTPECKDINPGSFHIVITNLLGIHSKGFVADIDRYNDVWNQPITSYEASIVGEEQLSSVDQANGITRKLRMKMRMTYGEELKYWTPELAATGIQNFVSKLPVTGTVHQAFRFKDYEYLLELDNKNKVVGGEWITATRPDFLWSLGRETKFQNGTLPLSGLNAIYRPLRR